MNKRVICRRVWEEAWTFHHAFGGGGTTMLQIMVYIQYVLGAASALGITELAKVQCRTGRLISPPFLTRTHIVILNPRQKKPSYQVRKANHVSYYTPSTALRPPDIIPFPSQVLLSEIQLATK